MTEEDIPTLYQYVRKHRDGSWMLMIANHRQCRCLLKSHDEAIIEQVHEHLEQRKKKYGTFNTLLHYYKIAKQRNIYSTLAY